MVDDLSLVDIIKQRARLEGIHLTDADFVESIDQHHNNPTGGGIIPGVSLSALMEDD